MANFPSIEVRHLRKVYGEIVAVDDLTFTVPRGAVKVRSSTATISPYTLRRCFTSMDGVADTVVIPSVARDL